MPEPDPFLVNFKGLFRELPPNDFAAWQFAYRQVVVAFAAEIFARFPQELTGPRPAPPPAGNTDSDGVAVRRAVVGTPVVQPDGGNGGQGIRPSSICTVGCLIDSLKS